MASIRHHSQPLPVCGVVLNPLSIQHAISNVAAGLAQDGSPPSKPSCHVGSARTRPTSDKLPHPVAAIVASSNMWAATVFRKRVMDDKTRGAPLSRSPLAPSAGQRPARGRTATWLGGTLFRRNRGLYQDLRTASRSMCGGLATVGGSRERLQRWRKSCSASELRLDRG